ncbi:MAG: bifunctional preprotein translocase subunit SecD/SecF [Lentisphaerae bacterium ADurb.BinA184]|nr:MAG: bifunctional preprotein translocase subunit SecD/SecF [Lentisphaerae bacterium ADurb.BinA184]
MKKSLIWRFALIAVVMAAWTYSIFPVKDRPFLDTFEKLAAPRVKALAAARAEAEAKLAAAQAKLYAETDTESEAAKGLAAEVERVRAETQTAARPHKDYEEVLARARELMSRPEAPVRAPQVALKKAAEAVAGRAVMLNQYVEVPTVPGASNNLVLSRVRQAARGRLHLGLDLQGGTEFIVGFDAKDVPAERSAEDVRDQIIEILRKRVDKLGVVEPEIKPTGPTSVSLRMPSVTEDQKAEVRTTLQQTAKLEFHLVHPNNEQMVSQYLANPAGFVGDPAWELKAVQNEQPDGTVYSENLFVSKLPSRVKGKDVSRAFASFNEFNSYYVSLTFNDKGAAAFADLTTENVGRRLAIVLDGEVYSAPSIREAILGGRAQITGSFGPEEARRLAGVIESGNLPVSIRIDSEFGTDPTLGVDSIRSGIVASIVGFVAVVLFMLFYYRVAGLVADIALFANVVLTVGTLALTGATITLPGIAGLVLTMGMAVDANVLIFERIREELQNGKSLAHAIEAGYRRAFITIFDSNLTTVLTALILLRVGTGSIRGFAVTLAIGIAASMFTALFVTRAIFDLMVGAGWIKTLSMATMIRKTHIDFLALKKPAYAISIGLIVLSIAWIAVKGRDVLSIDFAGGTAAVYRVVSGEAPEVGVVRGVLADAGVGDCRIGYKQGTSAEGRLLEVVLPARSSSESAGILDQMAAQLEGKYPDSKLEHVQTDSVGSLVGARFQLRALVALLLSFAAIIVYVAFRFEFTYGVASVIALVHDVIVSLGLAVILGRQLSMPVVAALLTIVGYSINDTIVIFDRIREDISLLKSKTYDDIINLSVNETLSRTLLTSFTTLLVVVVLFLFGGGAINDFALVMILGIIAGSYSTVFVASAIISGWHKPSAAIAEASKARAKPLAREQG